MYIYIYIVHTHICEYGTYREYGYPKFAPNRSLLTTSAMCHFGSEVPIQLAPPVAA